MKSIKFTGLMVTVLLTAVMIASAQEKKPCEYEGKIYQHREQVWQKEEGGKCAVCWDGQWVTRPGTTRVPEGANAEKYCQGKY
jgi:hypothetical protein